MKLTIIHPCLGRIPGKDYIRSWEMEPLGPAYLAALVPVDVEVVFYDDRIERIPFGESTDLVAIGTETYTAKRASYQIASEYRRRGITVVIGGFHATLLPDEVMQYADAVVCGEAELTFPQLLADFKAGIMRRVYKPTSDMELKHILPDRTIFKNKNYLDLGLVEYSRGCPYSCDFCAVSSFYDAKQTYRAIDLVLEDIDSLSNSKKLIFFVDDNFIGDKHAAKILCNELASMNIKWVSQADITLADDAELLSLMTKSGCQGLLIGFESLKESNLKMMNKGLNTSQNAIEQAVKKIRDHGIRIYGTFIFGYDYDTLDDFDRTLDFCRRNKFFLAAFNHLLPFPGTPLYRNLEDESRMLYKKWWLDDRYRYGELPFQTKIPMEIIQARCLQSRNEFYNHSSIWSRALDKVNSNNLYMLGLFISMNYLIGKESKQRVDYPLGDMDYLGKLIKYNELDHDL